MVRHVRRGVALLAHVGGRRSRRPRSSVADVSQREGALSRQVGFVDPQGRRRRLRSAGLKRSIFRQSVNCGHYGREGLPWEELDESRLASLRG